MLREDGARLERAVVVLVLEHEERVATFSLRGARRVRERLGDPEPSLRVECERDRLLEVGLRRDQVDVEAIGDRHRAHGLGGGEARMRDHVGHEDRRHAGGAVERGLRVVEAEVVEVDVAPAAGGLVDEAHEDRLAHGIAQVDDDALH